ncbi:MAG: DUF4349 domain-containing protein [Clostridia bacterium]|nr:DUF4349 domain-containing protein [Clostridia bacterium]
MKKIIALTIVLLIALCMFVSCGASDMAETNGGGYYDKSESPSYSADVSENTGSSYAPEQETDYERKIIKTYNLTLETKNYDSAKNNIINTTSAMGGYIAESAEKDNVTYSGKKDRTATFTVRVPSAKIDAFVDAVCENVSVLSKRLSTEDITTAYYDIESQLESLVAQEERIEALIEKADTLDYLIQLEDKLASIRAQINSLNKRLQQYDKSVDMSYVYISLDEVVEYTEIVEEDPTFGMRIKEAFVGTFENFVDFCQGFVIALVWLLPVIIIAAIVVPVVIILTRRADVKRKAKFEAAKKAREENAQQNKN